MLGKANPSMGHTFLSDYLREQVEDARGMPAKESLVRRLNFCQWVDAENPWISGDIWMACEKDISIEQLRVKPALAVWIYRVNVTLHRCLFIFLTSV